MPPAPLQDRPDISIEALTLDGHAGHATISPDGRFIAYVRRDATHASVIVKQLGSNSEVAILPPSAEADYYAPSVTPDGSYVDVLVDARRNPEDDRFIVRVPFLGGSPRRIVERAASGIGWSPDGRQMAFVPEDATELVVADASGQNQKAVLTVQYPRQLLTSFHGSARFGLPPANRPAWSPDGRTIAVSAVDQATVSGDVIEVDVVDRHRTCRPRRRRHRDRRRSRGGLSVAHPSGHQPRDDRRHTAVVAARVRGPRDEVDPRSHRPRRRAADERPDGSRGHPHERTREHHRRLDWRGRRIGIRRGRSAEPRAPVLRATGYARPPVLCRSRAWGHRHLRERRSRRRHDRRRHRPHLRASLARRRVRRGLAAEPRPGACQCRRVRDDRAAAEQPDRLTGDDHARRREPGAGRQHLRPSAALAAALDRRGAAPARRRLHFRQGSWACPRTAPTRSSPALAAHSSAASRPSTSAARSRSGRGRSQRMDARSSPSTRTIRAISSLSPSTGARPGLSPRSRT